MGTIGVEVQWGLKTGVPLSDFVSQCIDARTPTFRRDIESWKATLPAANMHVRFFIPELLAGGNPAQDFFNLFGLSEKEFKFESEARNPSLDVSVLHVLSKNPHLFSDVHDNRLTLALTRALSKKFRSTNIQMLFCRARSQDRRTFLRRKPVALEYVLQRRGRGSDLPHAFHAAQSGCQIFRYD